MFIGQNGQGKTNLLEAIGILSHAVSSRTSQEKELIQHGSPFALIQADIEEPADITEPTDDSLRRLEIQYHLEAPIALRNPDGRLLNADLSQARLKTRFKQNDVLLKSRSLFLGYLPTVSFFLSDLLLLRGVPEERRRWLDAAIIQVDKAHLRALSQYQKIKTQKSRLLKESLEMISPMHLDVWNAQLAKAAALVTSSRLQYLSKIQDKAVAYYSELSGGDDILSIAYQSRVLEYTGDFYDLISLETAYLNLLESRKQEELRRGSCLVGPHREDIQFLLGQFEAQHYGSQGQQRTIVLALKLAELWLFQAERRLDPVLLLDDVMAELDLSRQQFLIQNLNPQSQVLMTTTHMDQSWHRLFQSDQERVFEVKNGSISTYGQTGLTVGISSL